MLNSVSMPATNFKKWAAEDRRPCTALMLSRRRDWKSARLRSASGNTRPGWWYVFTVSCNMRSSSRCCSAAMRRVGDLVASLPTAVLPAAGSRSGDGGMLPTGPPSPPAAPARTFMMGMLDDGCRRRSCCFFARRACNESRAAVEPAPTPPLPRRDRWNAVADDDGANGGALRAFEPSRPGERWSLVAEPTRTRLRRRAFVGMGEYSRLDSRRCPPNMPRRRDLLVRPNATRGPSSVALVALLPRRPESAVAGRPTAVVEVAVGRGDLMAMSSVTMVSSNRLRRRARLRRRRHTLPACSSRRVWALEDWRRREALGGVRKVGGGVEGVDMAAGRTWRLSGFIRLSHAAAHCCCCCCCFPAVCGEAQMLWCQAQASRGRDLQLLHGNVIRVGEKHQHHSVVTTRH